MDQIEPLYRLRVDEMQYYLSQTNLRQ